MKTSVWRRLAGWGAASAAATAGLGALAVSPREDAKKVADLLDRFVQPRFAQADGKFGASRVILIPGHAAANLVPTTPEERKLAAEAQDARRSYNIALLHVPHPPGKDPSRLAGIRRKAKGDQPWLQTLVRHGAESSVGQMPRVKTRRSLMEMSRRLGSVQLKFQQREKKFENAAVSGLSALKRGQPIEKRVDGWLVSARPVVASAACISCHNGAKQGQTLGVMVYSVREEKDPAGKVAVNEPRLKPAR
jgi:hypothetical protein